MDKTANKLIMYLLQTGTIDPNTGKLSDTASTHYTYEHGRFTADEGNKNSSGDAGGVSNGAKRERKEKAYL